MKKLGSAIRLLAVCAMLMPLYGCIGLVVKETVNGAAHLVAYVASATKLDSTIQFYCNTIEVVNNTHDTLAVYLNGARVNIANEAAGEDHAGIAPGETIVFKNLNWTNRYLNVNITVKALDSHFQPVIGSMAYRSFPVPSNAHVALTWLVTDREVGIVKRA